MVFFIFFCLNGFFHFFLFKWFFFFFLVKCFFHFFLVKCFVFSQKKKKQKQKKSNKQINKTMQSVFMFPSSRLKKTFIHPLEKKIYVPFPRPLPFVYHPPALFWYKESVDLFSYTFLILFFWYSLPLWKVFMQKK